MVFPVGSFEFAVFVVFYALFLLCCLRVLDLGIVVMCLECRVCFA